MPDYAPNYTGRVKLRYRVMGRVYTMGVRGSTVMDATEAQGVGESLKDALVDGGDMLSGDWTALDWSWCPPSSNIFLPLAGVATGDFGTSGTLDPANKSNLANAMHIAGRTVAGGKAGFFIYGTTLGNAAGAGSDFTVFTTENLAFATFILSLNAPTSPLYGNDGTPVVWYPRATVKDNDYIVRKVRQGI
jgi:hypothetical protein